MKATEAKLLDFLKKSPQFVIPIYQRTYSWTEKECHQLWDDITRAGGDDKILAHFVGSIVYIEKGLYQVSSQSPMLVIDGQQRLTTVTILLSALAKVIALKAEDKREPLDGFSPKKIRNYFLMNPEEEGERRFKLILSQTDKTSLMAIVNGDEMPKEHSIRISENFKFFENLLMNRQDSLAQVCKGIAKLIVVDVALSRDQDNPQLIFESMNSTGKELSQADLIRNYVLMGVEPTLQTRLYENYWRPMELDFGQEAYVIYFDSFMRHFLTVKTGEIPNISAVYDVFKTFALTSGFQKLGAEELVKEIRDFSKYFCAFALGLERDPELGKAFAELRELKVDVSFPFLLSLYADYANKILSKIDFINIVKLIESYVFRRAVCRIPTNSMNKTFALFSKSIKKDSYYESVLAQFLSMPSYRRFPTDEEFKRDIQTRDLYNFRNRSYWLRKIENYGRKERVDVDEYTIEHIMPQNENLNQAWQAALGTGWKEVQQQYLHTLGNLTLTGYNSEYSDKSFIEKRDMAGGFKESPLKLNKNLGGISNWDVSAINERALRLSEEANLVWALPKLSIDVLIKYAKQRAVKETYSIADHVFLSTEPNKTIFEAFRKAVQKLDPCVAEEFLKLYVAYKAETNFVDVIPQSKQLSLSINIPFNELVDPKKVCKDVTGQGRWGNGDVEVKLGSLDDLPYVLGLVRQALERQLEVTS